MLADVGNVEVERDTMDLQKDELLIIRYRLIRPLLDEALVQLL